MKPNPMLPGTSQRIILLPLCLAFVAGAAWAQQARAPSPTPTAPATREQTGEGKVIVLSPFVVTGEDDIGYYVSTSLSGSRMNTKLEDIAASVTVITPQQFIDTASTDVNDIFRYESNTEGVHTYTRYSIDRFGGLSESIQMAPETANRIRGIGSPDRAVDYFISIPGLPIDAYNIDRLTINRGPNSILYGLGSASGLVNASWLRANIDAPEATRVELRYGRWDDQRAVFRHSRTLIDGKLAAAAAVMYASPGYRQKPSSEHTRRYYGTVTYQPFRNTTLRAFYERYSTDFRRPNSQTPQDYVSQWRAAGAPTWNPTTMTITNGDGTQARISVMNDANVRNGSNQGLTMHPFNTRPGFLINDGQAWVRMQNQLGVPSAADIARGVRSGVQSPNQPEQILASAGHGVPLPSPLFRIRGINDKSIYDWDAINVLSTNFGRAQADSYQVTLEQNLFDRLFIELAWRREDFHSFDLNAQSGRTNGIYVDVNERLLDGTPNPFFRQAYAEVWEPTAYDNPQENESMRASAAYKLDFTDNDNWTRWLGNHNLLGFAERRRIDTAWYRWREAVISTHDWTRPPGSNKFVGPPLVQDMHRVYYLGSNATVRRDPGQALMLAPGKYGRNYPEGVIGQTATQTLRHFLPQLRGTSLVRTPDPNYPIAGGRPAGTWVDEQAQYATLLHDAEAQQTRIRSQALVLQSYLWDDRIVSTLGWRDDTREARFSQRPILNALGYRDQVPQQLSTFPNPWDSVSGRTSSRGVVFKPFRNWDRLDRAGQGGNYLAETLRGMSFFYNESDTFAPAGVEQSLFLQPLPLPTGEGKDYGFAFSLLQDKLVLRVNWYEASQTNARAGGDTGVVTSRARRMLLEGNWGFVDMIANDIARREGLPMDSLNPWDINDAASRPYLNEISQRSGLSIDFLHNRIGFNDTRTISSEGMEIGLDFNPSPNWSFKFTAGKSETIEAEAAPNTQRWLWGSGTPDSPEPNSQLARWRSAQFFDPRTGQVVPWWTTSWPGQPSWGLTPRDWYIGVVEAPMRVLIATQGTASPQQAKWRCSLLGNYRFNEGKLRGLRVGGSVRWEDKKSIGYYGLTNPNTGRIDQFDVSRPIWDDAQYYVDLWTSYTRRVFDDKVRLTVQLNVADLFENGGLRAVGANPDGSPTIFRILTPRRYYLTTTFEF